MRLETLGNLIIPDSCGNTPGVPHIVRYSKGREMFREFTISRQDMGQRSHILYIHLTRVHTPPPMACPQ